MPNFKHVNNGLIDSSGKLKCCKLSILDSTVYMGGLHYDKTVLKNNLGCDFAEGLELN